MDVLTDVLAAFRSGRAVASQTVAHGPWGLRFTDPVGMVFHIALQGTTWLCPADGEPVRLAPGDVILLPDPGTHVLCDEPGSPTVDFTPDLLQEEGTAPNGRVTLSGDGHSSRSDLLCGAYLLHQHRPHPLLGAMPRLTHLRGRDHEGTALGTAVSLLHTELQQGEPGASTAVASLVDVLLVYIVRAAFIQEPDSWAAALTDPPTALALQAIHREPSTAWTVESLAQTAGLSRAAFAQRFRHLVGEPPLTYLTRWRMVTAARLLADTGDPLQAIARQVGYTSEFAFSKAFKRDYGVAPGSYRQRERTGAPMPVPG
jgi:AraC-like DNA-binding protein